MINKKLKYLLIVLVGILFLLPAAASAIGNGKEKNRTVAKTTGGQIATTAIDINNIYSLEQNNGFSDFNPNSNLEGAQYPKGSGKNFVFTAGFLWGGFVPGDPQVRVGGSAYISGLQPGPMINGTGAPGANSDVRWSIYRVRPDVYPGGPSVDLSGDASVEGASASAIRAQYESDWTNWPAAGTANDLGAPFTDVNGDGKYEPGTDIPGVPGADQTVYYVANDQDPSLTNGLYGAKPLGIEVHVTFWAYAQQGALGNMYFKKWDIINKGQNQIDSMFASYWTDVDLGNATDDLVGCDTTLSLQFTYNGQANDAVYAPLPPPADGFDFFQGPVVPGAATDSAIVIAPPFKFQYVHGEKNLPMTAAYFFVNGDANFGDPPQGDITGSTQFYNFFNGNYGLSGLPFVNPINNQPTKFAFSGDPVAGTGWLDGVALPPGDRRQGMASGPFNMAPGDTQQVVVAEMVAGAIPGVDRLSAISLVKFYDQTAQFAYNSFFVLPTPPPAPKVIASQLSNKIVLDWGEDVNAVANTEKYANKGYTFQGYNVYQLPYKSASISEAKRLATYDVVDGVGKIFDEYFDISSGAVLTHVSEFGNDTGIQRSFFDSTDSFSSGKPLVNGIPYYFAVTAYGYNANGTPHALENPISVITVIPQNLNPGYTAPNSGAYSNIQHAGTADATLGVTVVNPSLITGDQYQVSFHDEKYSLGSTGKWTDITAASKMRKVTDLTGSSIVSSAAWGENPGQFAIHYLVNVVSVDYDWCDGIQIKLPSNVVVDEILNPVSNNTGGPIPYTFDKSTNSIFFGDSSRSANGVFAGGEDITILTHSNVLPIIANYTMYDDGYGHNIVDVSSTDTLTTIANKIITQHQWNVKDLTSGNIVLKNQTIINGQDIYAPELYFSANSIYGPGGSTGSFTASVGTGANVTFAGMQLNLSGSYVAPTTISNIIENVNANSSFTIEDFTAFGYPDGTAATSLPIYGGAGGTSDINSLQQDYDLRWTGVLGDTTINGHTVVITKSGGSIATIFGASNYKLANHPLNPNPGSKNPFTIRIPFEVWNITKNEQVNLLVYDRNAGKTNDPTKDGFEVWNENDRVYTWVVNTKYTPTVINPTSSIVADSATWNWFFAKSVFTTGDDIKIIYNNPIQIGKDTFTFSIPKSQYSPTLAKSDVSNINVFPNPYYGVNSQETTKYARFVTFNHLPATATIHIFNLAGIMVKTINHTDGTQFQQWDLTNDSGLPVGSGLYIAYIDMPSIGTTKIIKLAIIQEQQYPDHF
ncbi:MAG: hypothetical protein ACYDA4_02195 [Ignavibacteriaceae bacterium]